MMSKKFLALLLALVMVVTAVPMTFAEGEETEPTYVAEMGENKFESLQAAVDVAGTEGYGTEITLIAKVDAANETNGEIRIAASKTVTINGKTGEEMITGPIYVVGNLTLNDLKVKNGPTHSGYVSQYSKSAICLISDAELVCNRVTFEQDGSTTNNETTAVTAWWSTGNGANMELNNCVFNCNGQRPLRSDANVTVTGCTFNDPYRYAVQMTSKASTITAEGDAIVTFKNNIINAGTTTTKPVYGIQLEGETYGCSDITVNGTGNTINLGSTGKDSAMYYCECTEKVDHVTQTWNTEVKPVHESGYTEPEPEAKIGTTSFNTLEEAIAAANQNGGTVTLLKDVEVEKTIEIKNMANAFTLDGTDSKFSITASESFSGKLLDIQEADAKVTIQNVTLNGGSKATYAQAYASDNVEFSNVKFEGFTYYYALGVNTSNVTLSNGTEIDNATGIAAVNIDITDGEVDETTASLTANDGTVVLKPEMVYSEKLTDVVSANISGFGNGIRKVQGVDMNLWAPIAKIGTTNYASVQAAVDAAKDNDTIVISGDSVEAVKVSKAVTFTIDWQNSVGEFTGSIAAGTNYKMTVTETVDENDIAVISATYKFVYNAPVYVDPEPIAPVTPVEPEEEPLVPEVDTNSTVTDSNTTENEDGSTTKSETLANGATVETTTKEDGSSTVTASKTETKENTDGSKTTTTVSNTTDTAADGSTVVTATKTETKENTDGSKTTTTTTVTESDAKKETTEVKEEVKVDEEGNETVTSTATTNTELSNGSTGTTTVENGVASAEVKVSEQAVTEAAEAGAAIELPMPAVTITKETEAAATVTVNVETEDAEVAVVIPVENVTTGTVAVIVNEDGTETIVAGTVPTENGVQVTVPAGATVKIVDNSMEFEDVEEDHEYADAVNFASARGIVEGDAGNFDTDGTATRAQVWTMLARISGVDTTNSDPWYAAGQQWAMDNGVSDGLNLTGNITTEQLFTMLHRMEGKPAVESTNADGSSFWAAAAHDWAVANGLVDADGEVIENATRGQVVDILMKYMTNK